MSENKLKKKQHTLLYELKYLYADLDYHETVLEEVKVIFMEEFKEFSRSEGTLDVLFPGESVSPQPKQGVSGPPAVIGAKPRPPKNNKYAELIKKNYPNKKRKRPTIENLVAQVEKNTSNKEVKNLHKKIAAMTHPDKLRSLSATDQKHRKEIFMKATSFAEKDNLFALQQIALELGIEIEEPTEEKLEILHKESEALRNKINNYKQTYAWAWFHEESPAKKGMLFSSYHNLLINQRGK